MAQAFRQRTPRTYVGSYRPRIDGYEKASGQAEYLDDIAAGMKGLLYAKVLRSPYPHTRINRLDTSRAEALPGVRCVLRYDDPEVAALRLTSNAWTSANTASYDQMYYPNHKDRRVLDSTVRWVGDEAGVVVAAESEALAEAALDAVDVDWERLPFVLDPDEAMGPDAPILHSEVNPVGNVLPPDPISGADVSWTRATSMRASRPPTWRCGWLPATTGPTTPAWIRAAA